MKKMLGILIVLSLTLSSNALGAIINFETVPGSSPADKVSISTQYESIYGVTFGLDTNGDGLADGGTPYLERTGSSDSHNAFINSSVGQADVESSGYEGRLGNYFLRLGTQSLLSTPVPSLLITYSTPVSAASAEIWDIDGNDGIYSEKWIITALDEQKNIIDTLESPEYFTYDSSTLDGKPWVWSFNHSSEDISCVAISFAGSKTSGIGLAFDNFSPSSAVPIPGAVWLLGSGIAGLAGTRIRRKKK